MTVVFALALLCLVSALVAVVTRVFGDVSRSRVERFAVRQALPVTEDNGDRVIGYLATTRRWRGGLLCLALLAATWGPVATRQGVDLDLLAAFAGWFVGAVIAEWRVDTLARGPQVAAILRVRRLTDYVSRPVVVATVLVWAVVGVLGVTALVVGRSRSTDRPVAAAALLAGALVAVTIVGVVRRILRRPQPLAALDLLEADDAIRGRSLHVLLGSALAIAGYLLAASVHLIAPGSRSDLHLTATLVGFLALPACGVVVARRARVPRRPVVDAGAAGR